MPVGGGGAGPDVSTPAPLVWRAPEGPEGLAAVPVGGGGAWPDNEATRRAKLAARTARGRATAHGAAWPTGQNTRHLEQPWGHKQSREQRRSKQQGPEAPQRLGPLVCQLLTG